MSGVHHLLFSYTILVFFFCFSSSFGQHQGIPGKACIARAMYAQPVVTGTARVLTVEHDVDLLVPIDLYAHSFLKGHYGDDALTHGMVCGHKRFEDYDQCKEAGVRPIAMDELRAQMSQVPSCFQYLHPGGDEDEGERNKERSDERNKERNKNSVQRAFVTAIRNEVYTRVAKKSLVGKEFWTVIKYRTQTRVFGKMLFASAWGQLLAPGNVELANVEIANGLEGRTAQFHPVKMFVEEGVAEDEQSHSSSGSSSYGSLETNDPSSMTMLMMKARKGGTSLVSEGGSKKYSKRVQREFQKFEKLRTLRKHHYYGGGRQHTARDVSYFANLFDSPAEREQK